MSPLLCPSCSYDCTGIKADRCPECGTGVTFYIISTDQLLIDPRHIRSLLISFTVCMCLFSIARLYILTVSERMNDREIAIAQQENAVSDYSGKMSQWWWKMRDNQDPGLVPEMPTQTIGKSILSGWKFGVVTISCVLLPLVILFTGYILWRSYMQPFGRSSFLSRFIGDRTLRYVPVLWMILSFVFIIGILF